MRVAKVADSPIFCDKTENTSLYIKENVVNKNALSKHYPKGIIIFPYGDKQIILLTSMRNNNPELQ